MTLEGPRVMNKNLLGCIVNNDESALPTISTGPGWNIVAGTTNVMAQREYFDLSGYQLEDLTVFFQGIEMQEARPVLGSDNFNQVIEIISTEFLTDAEIAATIPDPMLSGSGFTVSTMNQEQIVYARRRMYYQKAPATTPIIPFLHSASTWGTCAATTADKLHITRILTNSTVNSLTNLGDVNVVVAAIISKESELPFLMRQKRSYELATGP